METYYKATRPDGTDFRTGQVDYAALCGTGGELPRKPDADLPFCCSGHVYHASTIAAETLIGGEWPCRLFEVEGIAVAAQGSKRGFYTMKVIRELPAHEALGPQGEEVAALIENASVLSLSRIRALVPSPERGFYDLATAAQQGLRAAAMVAAATAVHAAILKHAPWDMDRMRRRFAAARAADAARALVVKDLISPAQFEALFTPWASIAHDEAQEV